MRGDARSEPGLLDAMPDIGWHGLAGRAENGRLVHVVPEAGDAVRHEVPVQSAPPVARALRGEFRKHREAGPHGPHVGRTVGKLEEMIAGGTAVVGRVPLAGCVRNVQVSDGDQVYALSPDVPRESRQVGKSGLVGGEGPVAVLVVDVHPDHIGRDAFGAHAVGDAAHFRGTHVTVARLLEAERPLRRERRLAAQVGVALDHAAQRRSVNQVVVNRPVRGTEGEHPGILPAKVKPAPPGVVQQEAVAAGAPPARDEEGNALVDRIGRFLESEGIRVPVDEGLAAAVQRTGLVAQPEIVLRRRQLLVQRKGGAVQLHGFLQRVRRHNLALQILDDQAQGRALDPD